MLSNPLLTSLRAKTFPDAIKHPGEKGGNRVIYVGEPREQVQTCTIDVHAVWTQESSVL